MGEGERERLFSGSFVKGALDLLKVRKNFYRAVLRKMNVEGK